MPHTHLVLYVLAVGLLSEEHSDRGRGLLLLRLEFKV